MRFVGLDILTIGLRLNLGWIKLDLRCFRLNFELVGVAFLLVGFDVSCVLGRFLGDIIYLFGFACFIRVWGGRRWFWF